MTQNYAAQYADTLVNSLTQIVAAYDRDPQEWATQELADKYGDTPADALYQRVQEDRERDGVRELVLTIGGPSALIAMHPHAEPVLRVYALGEGAVERHDQAVGRFARLVAGQE